jgi:hypothetical protein
VKNSLERLVRIYRQKGRVHTYENIAAKLSDLAGLNNGHVWSWNYVASAHAGAIMPGLKFIRAVDLCLEQISSRQMQWFYFIKRRSVAAIYDKTVLRDVIIRQMMEMKYKPVNYSRYAEIKRSRNVKVHG